MTTQSIERFSIAYNLCSAVEGCSDCAARGSCHAKTIRGFRALAENIPEVMVESFAESGIGLTVKEYRELRKRQLQNALQVLLVEKEQT